MKKLILCLVLLLIGIPHVEAKKEDKPFVIGMSREFTTLNPMTSQAAASSYIYGLTMHTLNAIDLDWKWSCWLCTEIPTLENGKVKNHYRRRQKEVDL